MSPKPMHGGIISENVEARVSNVEGMATDESGGPPQRALVVTIFRHLSFVIFPSIFRAPNDSERLSTCPAPAGLISERGGKDHR